MRKTAFLYSPLLSQHVLSDSHPMRPIRLQYTYDLLNSYDIFDETSVKLVRPRSASAEELSLIHSQDYISAVESLSSKTEKYGAARYGFSAAGDNPI